MSIDITITQKTFIKKPIPLEVILGDNLHYGTLEGMCLVREKTSEDYFVAYNPDHIGRGFTVAWTPKTKKKIEIRSLTPTNPVEIEELFGVVLRIMKYWDCVLSVDGVKQSNTEFLQRLQEFKDFNEKSVKSMFQRIIDGDHETLTLFSSMWPLGVGKEEAEKFVEDPQEYYKWLHDKQAVEANYVTPGFFRSQEGIEGKYIVSDKVRCIIPLTPCVPYGTIDPETGKELICDTYSVAFFSNEGQRVIGTVPFDQFIEFIKPKALKHDAASLIFDGLSVEEMESMLTN